MKVEETVTESHRLKNAQSNRNQFCYIYIEKLHKFEYVFFFYIYIFAKSLFYTWKVMISANAMIETGVDSIG